MLKEKTSEQEEISEVAVFDSVLRKLLDLSGVVLLTNQLKPKELLRSEHLEALAIELTAIRTRFVQNQQARRAQFEISSSDEDDGINYVDANEKAEIRRTVEFDLNGPTLDELVEAGRFGPEDRVALRVLRRCDLSIRLVHHLDYLLYAFPNWPPFRCLGGVRSPDHGEQKRLKFRVWVRTFLQRGRQEHWLPLAQQAYIKGEGLNDCRKDRSGT